MDSSEAREGRRDAVTCRLLATPKPAVKNALTKRASAADFDLNKLRCLVPFSESPSEVTWLENAPVPQFSL